MPLLPELRTGEMFKNDPQGQIESLVKQLNDWGRAISNESTTKIYKDDSGLNRVLLGKGANNFQGIKVSKTGFDVYDTSDENILFSSDNNIFNIVQSGTTIIPGGTVPANSSLDSYVDVTHEFDFIPLIMAFSVDPDGTIEPWAGTEILNNIDNGTSYGIQNYISRYVISRDDQIARFGYTHYNAVAGTQNQNDITIKYYLFTETAT